MIRRIWYNHVHEVSIMGGKLRGDLYVRLWLWKHTVITVDGDVTDCGWSTLPLSKMKFALDYTILSIAVQGAVLEKKKELYVEAE